MVGHVQIGVKKKKLCGFLSWEWGKSEPSRPQNFQIVLLSERNSSLFTTVSKCLKAFQSNWKSVSRIRTFPNAFPSIWPSKRVHFPNLFQGKIHLLHNHNPFGETMRSKNNERCEKKNQDILIAFLVNLHNEVDHCLEGLDKLGLNNPRWVNFLAHN